MTDQEYVLGQGLYEVRVPALSFLPPLEDLTDPSAPYYIVQVIMDEIIELPPDLGYFAQA